MQILKCLAVVLVGFMTPLFLTGCDSAPQQADGGGAVNNPGEDAHEGHDHGDHDHTAPHGGHLIELGRAHEYHAELVENHDSETITVYILDSHMAELMIGSEPIVLNLTADGDVSTFELAAVSAEGKDGASQFESADKELFQKLESNAEIQAKLRVTINGSPYSGELTHHDHDH